MPKSRVLPKFPEPFFLCFKGLWFIVRSVRRSETWREYCTLRWIQVSQCLRNWWTGSVPLFSGIRPLHRFDQPRSPLPYTSSDALPWWCRTASFNTACTRQRLPDLSSFSLPLHPQPETYHRPLDIPPPSISTPPLSISPRTPCEIRPILLRTIVTTLSHFPPKTISSTRYLMTHTHNHRLAYQTLFPYSKLTLNRRVQGNLFLCYTSLPFDLHPFTHL